MLDADQPIKTSDEDDFGRDKFAQRIANVIIKRNDESSIAIGIHAPWGEGKTSVLYMIIEELDKEEVLHLTFNPWRFPDEEQLIRNFYFELAKKLGVSLETQGEKISSFARRTSKAFNVFRSGISDVVEIATISETTIEILRERIEKSLRETKKRIVIIMDDIDRLDKNEVQAVFRLVKLTASLPYTAYILSFDEQRVAQAISEIYGGDIEAGRNFLEKIIQVSLPLPPPPPQKIMDLTRSGINSALKLAEIELTKEQINRFSEDFDKTFREQLTTPRISKRLSNALSFSLPLMKGEVDDVDLIYVEAIKVFYPNLYKIIREKGDLICGTQFSPHTRGFITENNQFLREEFQDAFEKIPLRHHKLIKKLLLALFPQFDSALGVDEEYAPSDELIKSKRVCTQEYFSRYFTYGVQPHDMSDIEVDNFLHQIPTEGKDFVIDYFEKIFGYERARVNTFINKLRRREDELEVDTAQNLALGIASTSHRLPYNHPEDRLVGMGTYSQVARLLVHLVMRITRNFERDDFAIKLTKNISSLLFAHDFAVMIDSSNETEKSNKIVSKECKERINLIVSEKIAKEADKKSLEEKYYLDARELYEFWKNHNSESLSNYLKKRINDCPKKIIDFLAVLLRVNLKEDESYVFYFHKNTNWYLFVSELIEPEIILEKLKSIYPDLNGQLNSIKDRRSIANWFLKEYKHSKENIT